MKKIVTVTLLSLPFYSFAQQKGFEIKGKIGNWNAPVKLYLSYGTKIDSVQPINGEFVFKGQVDEPILSTLILDEAGLGLSRLTNVNADYIQFYLAGEVLTMTSGDSARKAVVTGSVINEEGKKYTAYIRSNTKKSSDVEHEMASMAAEKQNDPVYQQALQNKIQDAREELKGALTSYIEQHPSSYFSLLALSNLVFVKADGEKAASLYKKIAPQLQNTSQGKKIAADIEVLRTTSIGASAPVFSQPTADGTPVTLSSFKGKYVLIDFWASWCMPCRLENPNLVKAYQKYHSKGLEILGVSLDGEMQRAAWLDAIKKDSLSWTQVSDLKGGDNAAAQLYGVQSIPQNFLIDPNGKIIALSLRGEDLNKKLESIFTK